MSFIWHIYTLCLFGCMCIKFLLVIFKFKYTSKTEVSCDITLYLGMITATF